MMRSSVLIILFFFCATSPAAGLDFSKAASGERGVFKGKVNDTSGRAAGGVNLFIYDSPEVKRQTHFIAQTDKDGRFRISLPAGKFWAVARLKKSDGYGPLMSGDKHSGEPIEIEIVSGTELEVEFTIKDLKDAVSSLRKTREDFIKVQGRILDIDGKPVKMAYAIANRNEKVAGVPDHLSSWTDAEGRYVLYLPHGKYYLGCAFRFPPGQDYFMDRETLLEADKYDFDIIIKSAGSK